MVDCQTVYKMYNNDNYKLFTLTNDTRWNFLIVSFAIFDINDFLLLYRKWTHVCSTLWSLRFQRCLDMISFLGNYLHGDRCSEDEIMLKRDKNHHRLTITLIKIDYSFTAYRTLINRRSRLNRCFGAKISNRCHIYPAKGTNEHWQCTTRTEDEFFFS